MKLIVLVLAIALSSCVPYYKELNNRPGGFLVPHYKEYERYKEAKTKVKYKGFAKSAATIFIGLPDACTHKTTRFEFHAPTLGFGPRAPLASKKDEAKMTSYYPKPLRAWYYRNIPAKNNEFVILTGEQLINMKAIKPC